MQIASVFFIFLGDGLLFPNCIRKFSEGPLDLFFRARRVVASSDEDEPGSALTPSLINLLTTRKVQASFFVMQSSDKSTRPVDGMAHVEYVPAPTSQVIEYAGTNGYALIRPDDAWRGGC